MPSLIPGFDYDIFISYRQKDNKGDRWVSEFVEALRTELESTFKEEVSVYFDINPHDGLLETHEVDESLKEKLKCLVFIPVISRTYCDQRSFAWEHEFRTFVEQASGDQFGLKVKLPGGNVGSRVLPVRIHDLDNEDVRLCESVLGGVLRGVEFIFKSPGVNRPLYPKEENPQDNQNHTFYRDQINKVANAVKEIIAGMKYSETDGRQILAEEEPEPADSGLDEPVIQRRRRKIGLAMLILLTLFIITLLTTQNLSRRNPAKNETGKTIAVLPFQNLSNDSTQLWFCDGFVEDIRNNLQKVKSFTVRSKLSSDQYRDQKKASTDIGRELNADYLVGGSVSRERDFIKIWVHLSDSRADKQIWSNEYTRPMTQIFSLQSEIAREIVTELNTVLSPEEKASLEKSPTKNPEAYNLYKQGRFLWDKRTKDGMTKSIEYYEKSIAVDTGFALGFAGLADTYLTMVYWDWWPREDGFAKAKENAARAVKMDPDLAEAHSILGSVLMWSEWKWEDAEIELKQAIDLNPKYAIAYQYYSEYLDITRNFGEARRIIDIGLELDPVSSAIISSSALYYYNEGKFRESLDACLKLIEINPDFTKTYWIGILNYMCLGEGSKSFEMLQNLLRRDPVTKDYADKLKGLFDKAGINGVLKWILESELKKPEPDPVTLSLGYAVLGYKEEAINWLHKEYEERLMDLPRINSYYIFNNLRSEPGFIELLDKMGLLKYTSQ